MTAQVLGEATPVFFNTATNTYTITLSSTAGDTYHAYLGAQDGGALAINSITDTQGNTWTAYDSTADGTNITTWQLIAPNVAGGANTLKVIFSYAPSYGFLMLKDIGGGTSSPLDGHAIAFQSAPGTGAGAITAAAANTSNPALVSGFCVSVFNAGATLVATSGAGLSSQSVGTSGISASSSKRVLTNASQSLAYTQNSPAGTLTAVAIFDEATAGGVPITSLSGGFETLSGGIRS